MANSKNQWEEITFFPRYVIFVSSKFANYFLGVEKFPVNRKTSENNTLSQKKVEIFHRTIKRFWTLLSWNCRRYQSSSKLWKQGLGCPTIIVLTASIQFSCHWPLSYFQQQGWLNELVSDFTLLLTYSLHDHWKYCVLIEVQMVWGWKKQKVTKDDFLFRPDSCLKSYNAILF